MSLFFKDPKSCMNPWHGLLIIVTVCCFVMVALFIVQLRHAPPKNQYQQSAEGRVAVSPTVY